MPELAEVEYYRKQWDAGLGGQVLAVRLHGAKRIFRGSDPRLLARSLTGRKLLRSEAKGKQMLFVFSGGNWLGLHLGMTGKLRIEPADFRPEKHDHLVLRQRGRSLLFSDPRQFGRVRFHRGKSEPEWWTSAGAAINSAEFTQRFVREFLQRHRSAPIKAVLLLQAGFPGIGNWMADEILWRVRIFPATPSGNLLAKQTAALWRATRSISKSALEIIGADFSDPPKTWLLHERWKRTGKCPRDGTVLSRKKIGGRTTAWCPQCQG
jgi:formamidopyrimidine-DNA glycosylase